MKKVYRDFVLFPDIFVLNLMLVIIFFFIFWSGVTWGSLLFFMIGLVAFMLIEYVTHRFLFHLKAPRNPVFLKLLKRLHYDHHTDPNNLQLLFLPIWYSVPNFVLAGAIFYVITSNLSWTFAFSGGVLSMLLMYEWRHYVAHRPIKPRTRFGKWLKKLHLLHHFKNENYWYGVSTPFVDVLFGTLKKEEEVETSSTTKDLVQ